jgi:hypothetical protein
MKASAPQPFTELKQTSTPNYAVGWPAIGSSVKHVFGAMPVSRGLKSLFGLTQTTVLPLANIAKMELKPLPKKPPLAKLALCFFNDIQLLIYNKNQIIGSGSKAV